MSKLVELQKKYENAKYEPLQDCKKCNGFGEVDFPKEKKNKFTTLTPPDKTPCMCIFINPKFLGVARETLGNTIKKLKNELNNDKENG